MGVKIAKVLRLFLCNLYMELFISGVRPEVNPESSVSKVACPPDQSLAHSGQDWLHF